MTLEGFENASKNTENAANLFRRKGACTLEETRLARNIAYENELGVRE